MIFAAFDPAIFAAFDPAIFAVFDPAGISGGVPTGDGAVSPKRTGPAELAREFEPSAQAIRNWVAQADRDEGRRHDGLTTDERSERRSSRRSVRAIGPRGSPTARRFEAHQANALCVADITDIPTTAGTLYLAVVLDVWSRRIVGWAMAEHLRTALVLGALDMAPTQRRPTAVIHHSDQGCQYTAVAFGARCHTAGMRPPMGSVGDCYGNALCEVFLRRWNASSSWGSGFPLRPPHGLGGKPKDPKDPLIL